MNKVLKNKNLLLKILFVLCCPFYPIYISSCYAFKATMFGSFVAFICMIIFIFFIKDDFKIKKLLYSFFISLLLMSHYYNPENGNINKLNNIIYVICGFYHNKLFHITFCLLASIFFTLVVYLFIDRFFPSIISFFKRLSTVEKNYLIVLSVIGISFSIFISYFTTAFTIPVYDGNKIPYDVFYLSDSGMLSYLDVFSNICHPENDIRQPLFGFFGYPFSTIAIVLSKIFFFLPDGYQYINSIMMIQFILLAVTIILIARMLKISDTNKLFFYLFISVSFSYLLFSMMIEQYVVAVFYLVVLIYYYFNSKKVNYWFIAATGSLMTSSILFFMISHEKKIKKIIIDILKCGFLFFVVYCIIGQFPQLLYSFKLLKNLLSKFSENVSFVDKLYQYSVFVRGIFIYPKSISTMSDIIFIHPSYQLSDASGFDIIGIILFIIAVFGFILNRKNKFSQLCFFWICFSFVLLVLIGWGTVENGLTLYCLYFSFAFISLFYMFFRKIIHNDKVFNIFMIVCTLIMFIINSYGFYNIFKFAITYY